MLAKFSKRRDAPWRVFTEITGKQNFLIRAVLTRKLATVSFQASAPWQIRVGGVSGPASMLLPAFDILGMPYIPSTTLKGVTREIAERDRNVTPDKIREIFGELEPTACMGKVIFLDAYPLPFPEIDEESEDELSGLVPDMANSLWTWAANNPFPANPLKDGRL